jgi:hypothetical protein
MIWINAKSSRIKTVKIASGASRRLSFITSPRLSMYPAAAGGGGEDVILPDSAQHRHPPSGTRNSCRFRDNWAMGLRGPQRKLDFNRGIAQFGPGAAVLQEQLRTPPGLTRPEKRLF